MQENTHKRVIGHFSDKISDLNINTMKKVFTSLLLVVLTISVFTQAPHKMSYQAVIRNSTGQLVSNHAVGMRISILQGSASGTAVYVETQTTTTNANGLATIEIGGGIPVTGTFAGINWVAGPFYLKTETDPSGGTSYIIVGTSRLLSVPYTLYSKTSETLSLPFTGTVSNTAPAFQVTNNGGGEGIKGIAGSAGKTGIIGEAPNQGIFGNATATTGAAYGVQGTSASESGSGVTGFASSTTGQNFGVKGLSASIDGRGLYGFTSSATGKTIGVYGESNSSVGYGVYGMGKVGILGSTTTSGGYGVSGVATGMGTTGVHGTGKYGVVGNSASSEGRGIEGIATSASGGAIGVFGESHSTTGIGVYGGGMAVSGATKGIWGNVTSSDGYSGYFTGGRFYVSGNVGIGTPPTYNLDVAGTANLNKGINGIALRCNGIEAIWFNGKYFSWGYGGTWNYFRNKIFIGAVATDPGTNLLVVNGSAAKLGGGSWATWSDERLKEIHGIYLRGVNEILKLNPVMFSYREGNKVNLPENINYTGLIAQEVREVFPEAVSEDVSGYLQLDIHPINMALINAVKDLSKQNQEQQKQIDELKQLVNALMRK